MTIAQSESSFDMKMRVLIVAPSLGILGGQAVQASRLLEQLRAEPTLEVSLLPVNPALPGLFRGLQSIKYVRTIVTSILYGFTLLARVPKYDVIHIFSASYFSFLLAPTPALLASRLFRKKSLLNYRSGEAEDHLLRWKSAVRTMRLADEIVVPSGYLVKVFGQFGLKCVAIPNFVDLDRFRFRQRTPLQPTFLSNRNFEPLYNVTCILRAFAIIQRQIPEAKLTLVGDGSERSRLKQLSEELKLRNVVFAGRIEPSRMPEFYNANDIYLNSPDIDNMPGSIIEAFACGLPVVTTNAGGIPYILNDAVTGLMVERDDHEGLAAKAISLLKDGTLARRLSSNALEECRKYSWTMVRQEWLDLYTSLLNRDSATAKVQEYNHQESLKDHGL